MNFVVVYQPSSNTDNNTCSLPPPSPLRESLPNLRAKGILPALGRLPLYYRPCFSPYSVYRSHLVKGPLVLLMAQLNSVVLCCVLILT